MGHLSEDNQPSRDNGTIVSPSSAPRVRLESGDVLHLHVHNSLQPIKDEYEQLRTDGFHTLFNSPAWLNNWVATQDSAETPLFIVGRRASGQIAFVWPMSVRRQLGTRILGWLGQDVFAINLGCFARDVADCISANDIRDVFKALRRNGAPFDAVHLINQPKTWNGLANPMAGLPCQSAPNGNYARALQPDYAALYEDLFTSRERRNHARQRRRLADFGDVEMYQASTTSEQVRILDTFFDLKAAQLRVIGAPDPFRKKSVRTFYRQALLAIQDTDAKPAFCGVAINGTLVATLIGVTENNRFTTLMSAITLEPQSKASPGQQLLEYLVEILCDQGVEIFDFGPGSSTQKLRWEMKPQPLYNVYMAFASHAHPTTWIASHRSRLMHQIKNNDRAYRLLARARARVSGK